MSTQRFSILHVEGGTHEERSESVAHEEPLALQVNGASIAVLMRTPPSEELATTDEELALGFLLSERVIRAAADVQSIRVCDTLLDEEAEGNVLRVVLRPGVDLEFERLRRHTFSSSSCGVCGKASLQSATALFPPLTDRARVLPGTLAALPEALLARQSGFRASGGLHAAGLFSLQGEVVLVREDVGRHNAVDKVVGGMLRAGLAPEEHLLVVSGRIAFELVQKAAAARLPVIAGVSAPTSLAVRAGEALGVTVVGFLRGSGFNVYAAAHRIAR